ncbi:Uncharacterized conserved protein, contains Mth938-like domain [Paraburkholderia tropica]|uniref:Uncharacterized conserved protein, contains Mth938-like domain n=1 Tax=Paraburkholderia tropica TaxID=92647 RepID=A0AAQ1JUX6_9BURK|nr:Uncharacterized conserved protein, contains Mth938-like domain [Paraburkholderia tropica]
MRKAPSRAVPGHGQRQRAASFVRAVPAPARAVRNKTFAETFRNSVLKLHQDSSGALNTVTGYGADYVEINLERHNGSILVMPDSPVQPWPVNAFDSLTPDHFAALLPLKPEVVVFGSGERLRFPHPRLTAPLSAQRIGVEAMDFKAACRTYNILMAEGRRVALALLIEA